MGDILHFEGREVVLDMSPEFAAQLDIGVDELIGLIDLRRSSGRLWKLSSQVWHQSPPRRGRALFMAGWDTFDTSNLLTGEVDTPLRIYLASARHAACRAIAVRRLFTHRKT